jgi:hypothetical protein
MLWRTVLVGLTLFAGTAFSAEHSAPSKTPVPAAQPTEVKIVSVPPASPAVVEIAKVPGLEISSVPTLHVESTDRRPEWVLAFATVILAGITGALARYTYKLYRATVSLSSDAKLTAEQQTQRMERSITEAARAATAMEGVATATTQNTTLMPTLLRKQMRAYLSVEIGGATYQDARLRFAAAPVIANNGLTPARNVRFLGLAGIIDGSNIATTQFAPVGELPQSDMGIVPRQSVIINAVVPNRVPDDEVASIMAGATRRLFCWGKVTYDDVYGGSWETNFCLNYAFYTGEDQKVKINGWYYPKNNGAT